jgi:Ion channel
MAVTQSRWKPLNRIASLRQIIDARSVWSTILLLSVFTTVFVVAILPVRFHNALYSVLFSLMFIAAVLSLEKRSTIFLSVALSVGMVEWISAQNDVEVLIGISRALNIFFFAFIVIRLIAQIARTARVDGRVILAAINGYLLLGTMFAMIVSLVMNYEPAAFTFRLNSPIEDQPALHFSDYLYYTLVTFTTVGYGDIVPRAAYTKSLAMLIGVSGQIYVAVIIAMLVGKFASAASPE